MKRKSSGGGGANWMDTYGDMVTLLLCFFVLLYSMSTISEEKWKALVMSFNPDSIPDQTEIVGGNDGPSSDAEMENNGEAGEGTLTLEDLVARQEEINAAFDELYQKLLAFAENSDMADSIQVSEGDGYVFISFRDTVFFDGESYEIRADGEEVLSVVADMFSQTSEYIDEVRVMGHTAQGSTTEPNRVEWDRTLSSQRAANAASYIQLHSTLDAAKIVSVGYGQHRPVAPNDTAENRAKNRRVEILVTGYDLMDELGDSIEQYYTMIGVSNPETEETESAETEMSEEEISGTDAETAETDTADLED